MTYIITSNSIVFFSDGKPIKVQKDAPEYPRLMKCFDLIESEQDNAINAILKEKTEKFVREGFEIDPTQVVYNGERLPTALADKVRSIAHEGLPVNLFKNFWESLQENPSANSVRQLYDFLAYRSLPITSDGCFIAYKGVQKDGWSCHGNKHTKVLQGEVDSAGKIKNNVGDTIEVLRRDVDDERSNHCSFGLHVGSLAYAESFAPKVLVVKVNPKNVVSVPDDCSCQKCRVSEYQVIDSFDSEIFASVTDSDGNPIESEEDLEHQEFVDRIQAYLEKKARQGFDQVSVQSIQNSFSPEYPSRIRVLDALNEVDLDIAWNNTDSGWMVHISDII